MIESCWSHEPLTFFFDSEEELLSLCFEIEKLQRKLLFEHMYNSVSSLTLFYREYKSGTTPMPDFYHNYVAVHNPQSPNCVGNAILLRDELLHPKSYILEHYPDLQRYLYFASSNYVAHKSMEKIPDKYSMQPPLHITPYKEHVLLCLKICFNGRDGYVLLDIGCQISKPVIVMVDGKPPHTDPFCHVWAKGPMTYSYKLEGNYIHWKITGYMEGKQLWLWNRWIYVLKKFTRLQDAEKNTRVDAFHAMVTRGLDGPEAGIFLVYGRHKGVSIYIKRKNEDLPFVLLVPFEYLLATDGNGDNVYEEAVIECAAKMSIDNKDLREIMKALAEIQDDKDFFGPMMKLNEEHDAILEKCWENT